MKKLLLSLIVMVFAAQLSAQSLAFKYEGETIEPGTIDIVTNDITASPEVVFDLHIINTTDADINVVWEMNDTVNGEKIGTSYVCFGSCFGPNVITKSYLLAAGSEDMFQGHCTFANSEGLLPAGTVINVVYTFFDERNPEEKYVFNVNFKYEGIVCNAPQNLKVVVTKDDPNYNKKYKVTLTWDAIEGVDGYAVYAASQNVPDGIWMGNVTTNKWINGLDIDGELHFSVIAICDEDLSIISDRSEEIGVIFSEDLVDDINAITPPENLTATAKSNSSIILTWDEVENAHSYFVYCNDVEIANITETTYLVENLDANKEYCYTVTAMGIDSESDPSEEACATTEGESLAENTSYLNIFPNPVSDNLSITTNQNITEVNIYNILGVTVYNEQCTMNEQLDINVSDFNEGVYFIKVKTENGEIVKRFIKK